MGGKAIKMSERIPRKQFFEYASELLPKIKEIFKTEIHMVNSFRDKEDFGDIDILVKINQDWGDRVEIIKKHFNPIEIVRNTKLISFNYNKLQVDLIFTTEDNWETSKIFFEHGDLGNFMGKLISNYGRLNKYGYQLKYGYDGLKCKLKYDGSSKVIFLTKDSKKVFEFLGLDFNTWEKGFDNKEEMFEYVVNSKYFDYKSFQWVNLSSINKQRNKRRPNYLLFLNFIENYKNELIWHNYITYLNHIKDFFDVDLKLEMDKFVETIKIDREISKKFNGHDIMKLYPSLKGKELGIIINKFKKSFDNYKEFARNNNKGEIINQFKIFYEKYNV